METERIFAEKLDRIHQDLQEVKNELREQRKEQAEANAWRAGLEQRLQGGVERMSRIEKSIEDLDSDLEEEIELREDGDKAEAVAREAKLKEYVEKRVLYAFVAGAAFVSGGIGGLLGAWIG